MSATIPIPFALGVTVWWVGNGHRTEWIQCPECAGTRVIEMIKGNGEWVTLDCEQCSSGCNAPSGVIQRHVYEHSPTPFTPTRVQMHGDEFSYYDDSGSSGYASAKYLYATREKCAAACEVLNREQHAHQEAQLLASIQSKRKSLAFSAGYWSHQVKDLERKLEAARARLARSKAKKETA